MEWYEVEIPSHLKGMASNDYVSYTSNGTAYKSAACYAKIMGQLPSVCTDCEPLLPETKSQLSSEDYLAWMNLCKDNHLMPSGSEFRSEDGRNYAKIPGAGETKHRIYAALCCYRWTECLSPMCYLLLRLSERKKLDFFQLFHYVTGKHVTLTGHSMTNNAALTYNPYVAHRRSLLYALKVKLFFLRRPDGCLASKADQTAYTNVTIDTLFANIDPLPLVAESAVLDERWSQLFQMTDIQAIVKQYYILRDCK
jgi:hypothetical protein